MDTIALVGTGLVGRSWAVVFARAGHAVRLWDEASASLATARERIDRALHDLASHRLLRDEVREVSSRVTVTASLEEALAGADYVQESIDERVEVKRALFARMDAVAGSGVILASSTSTIPASVLSDGLAGRTRCLVAHPVNPPHLIPVVEIAPAPWTDPEVVARTRRLQVAAGQVPTLVRKEIAGFVFNRLQAALLLEAWRLVDEGYSSVDDLDKCMRDGLGLRWSFMGPFETIDLNAPGGIADYARRYGPVMREAMAGLDYAPWSAALVSRVAAERAALLDPAERAQREAWRDRQLMALLAHRRAGDDGEAR